MEQKAARLLAVEKSGEALLALRTRDAVKCPAGENHGERGVECRIEENLLAPTIDGDPFTIVNLCCNHYQECPTWRLSRKEGGSTATSFTEAARRARARQEDRDNARLAELSERFGGNR